MSKIVIPQTFYRRFRNSLTIPEDILKTNNALPFANSEHEYIFEVSGKKTDVIDSQTSIAGGFFNRLQIKGSIVINVKDIPIFIFYRYLSPNSSYNELSHYDWIESPSITINTQKRLKFVLNSAIYSADNRTVPIRELNLSASVLHLSLNDLKNLENITIINQFDPRSSRLTIRNLPKLQKLDLSNITKINVSNFTLENINPNCKIVLNKDLVFDVNYQSPIMNTIFRSFANYDISEKHLTDSMNIPITDIIPEIKDQSFEITYKELSQRMLKYELLKEIENSQKIIDQIPPNQQNQTKNKNYNK